MRPVIICNRLSIQAALYTEDFGKVCKATRVVALYDIIVWISLGVGAPISI